MIKPFIFSLSLSLAAMVCGCGGASKTCSSMVSWSGPAVAADGTLNRVVLSVWGDSPTSVYFVGGGRGVTGLPGLFMHWDGKNFTELGKLDPTLWWAYGFSANDVWAAGEKTSVVHWNGSKLTVVDLSGLAKATLSGIWGATSSDLWAVGGSLGGDIGENDVILHCTGNCEDKASWTKVTPSMTTGSDFFKIWGASANDIFLVGLNGVVGHYDGSSWTVKLFGAAPVPLLTVHGRSASEVYAVGGPPGTLLKSTDDGKTYVQDTSQAFTTGLTGVFAHPNGDLWVVGLGGQKFRLSKGAWTDCSMDTPTNDLHAVWIDSTGENGFAVGGNFTTPPTLTNVRIGVIARLGASIPAATVSGP